MSRPSLGAAPRGRLCRGTRPTGVVLVLLSALAAGGCQTTRKPPQDWVMRAVGAPTPPVVAAVKPKPDLEADGMEAQAPPPIARRSEPDDPSEPFSPNYGARPARIPVAVPEQILHAPPPRQPAAMPPLPQDLPPRFRKKLAAALAQ